MTELERIRQKIKLLEGQLVRLKQREAKLVDRQPGKWIAPD